MKTMNSDQYRKILQDKLLRTAREKFGDSSWIYQQDLAPCHASKKMKEFFSENEIDVLDWPGNSPDLNPIENVWRCMGRAVRERKPQNKRELQEAVVHAWHHEITPQVCENLVGSMKQ